MPPRVLAWWLDKWWYCKLKYKVDKEKVGEESQNQSSQDIGINDLVKLARMETEMVEEKKTAKQLLLFEE